MDIQIKQTTGTGVRSGAVVRYDQYTILVDGVVSGYIGFGKDCRCCLTVRFSPLDVKEIEDAVAKLIGQESRTASQVPDVPDELRKKLNPDMEDDDLVNDFDA